MVKRGTSDSRTRLSGRPCAGCGRLIRSGLYCAQCLEKFREKAKVQGERMETLKSNALKKFAEDSGETLILVVNSDERNLSITKIVLERGLPEYKIFTANNPLIAINVLVSRAIDLIILDADFNGLDMLRRIREDERFQSLSVMMMSGSTQRELVAEVFSLGVQDYLSKPCSPQDLVSRVSKMLGGKEKVAAPVSEKASENRPKTNFRIMIIEDDIFDLRQESEAVKNRFPCELITAQSAAEGMRILENQSLDLVLVNLDMPFINGLKFAALVNNNNRLKNIPVIIMTDTRDFTVISEIKRSPATGYVQKPNIPEADLALIESKLLRRG